MKTKIKTEWDLELLYKSDKDPQIETDLQAFADECRAFEEKYSKADFAASASSLLAALKDYEELYRRLSSSKPAIYFHLIDAIRSDDTKASAMNSLIRDRLSKEQNRIVFFELAIGKIPAERQAAFFASPELAHYRYYLELIFKSSRHDLTEAEEKILIRKHGPSHGMWEEGLQRALQKLTVRHGKKDISISEALSVIPNLPMKQRRALHKEVNRKLLEIGDFGESEYNAICTNKKIDDELRGYAKPYSSTLLRNQNTEKEVLTLIEAVEGRYDVVQRFYKLKKKILKLPRLTAPDRGASIGKMAKKITFEKGFEMIAEILGSLNPQYREWFEAFAKSGQVDAYPRKHKRGGAFCASFTDLPSYILLNWIDELDWAFVYAHETGHSIHAEFGRKQSPVYQGCTLSTAEVASTLFEQLTFDRLYPTLSDKEKVIALHDKIVDAIGTVFVQAAAFRFELEVHERIRIEGFLPKEAIADIYVKHMSKMSGNDVKWEREDGYMFIRWIHLRDFFYNYPYAYGLLVSNGLYQNWKKDPSYLKKIEQFMSAGTSKSPHDIFQDIGIDTYDRKFWETGIASIEKDIAELERLIAGKKK